MDRDVKEILLAKEDIKKICERLGAEITRDYEGKKLLLVSVLKGAVVFMADIMREIKLPCAIDFMAVSSYQNGTKSSGVVQFKKDLDVSVEGYDVLIIEDILDSGLSLKHITEILKCRGANSLKICTLLDKPSNRKCDISADYIGFTVPNEFIVGYGLDYAEKYRNLPYVGILKPEVYSK